MLNIDKFSNLNKFSNINKKCVICIVVRNCEKTLPNIFNNINNLKKIFDIIGIIFSTDNNNDNTIMPTVTGASKCNLAPARVGSSMSSAAS